MVGCVFFPFVFCQIVHTIYKGTCPFMHSIADVLTYKNTSEHCSNTMTAEVIYLSTKHMVLFRVSHQIDITGWRYNMCVCKSHVCIRFLEFWDKAVCSVRSATHSEKHQKHSKET